MRPGVYIACWMLLLSGCAHGNWRQSVAHTQSVHPTRESTPSTSFDQRHIQANQIVADQGVLLLRAQNPDQPEVLVTSSSAGKTGAVSHDAATLALIERETRSFTPEDRDRALAALKAIPSESVPAVLQLWKAGLISPLAHPTSPVILPPATASDLPSPKSLAGTTLETTARDMGRKSPWQNSVIQNAVHTESDVDEESNVYQAGYSVAADAVQSEQIQRVSAPVAGFSSPLGNDWNQRQDNGVVMPADFPFASQPTGQRSAAFRSQSAPPNMPADWQFRNSTLPRNGGPAAGLPPLSSNTGRPIVVPPDWQSQLGGAVPPTPAPLRSQPPMAMPPANNLAYSSSTPEYGDGPVIRPQRRTTPRTDSPSESNIQYSGYSTPDATDSSREIVVHPGDTVSATDVRLPALPAPPTSPRMVDRGPDLSRPAMPQERSASSDLPRSANDAFTALIRATEAEVGRLPPGKSAEELQYYIERHVYLRLLYLMSSQTEAALRPIPNIPSADQEFWTQVLWGMHNYFDLRTIPDHAERAAQAITQFNTALLRLKERAPLELKKPTFCNKIEGFGEYHTYARNEFTPGERVLLYAEIANFHSELSAAGIYRTRLKSTIQVIASEAPQDPVDVKVYPVTEDYCRNHRRDYFHSYVVEIPVRCVRGSHELKLIVEDELSGKVATTTVPFVVR